MQKTQLSPAVVLGADVSALNVVRSLGRKGVRVFVVGNNAKDYAAASRYAKFVFCEDLTDERKVISVLMSISRNTGRKAVLIATSDLHVLHISRNRDLLRMSYEFVLPDHGVIETLMDKRRFHDFADRHGFPVPMTFFSNNEPELLKIADQLLYPCVVKPLYRTAYWSQHVPPDKKVMKVVSVRELREKIEALHAMNQPLIIQEWIPGGDEEVYFCLAYLDRAGRALALFTGRKLRQYPPLTGVTSMAESIKSEQLAELTKAVFAEARCIGLCSLECKYDSSTDSFKITEPTVGRVDLQEGISTHAGIDIPFIAYQDALGLSPSDQIGILEGVKWINEPYELNSLLSRDSGNGTARGSFFKHYKGKRSYAVTAADDPGPFLRFVAVAGGRGLRYLRKAISN